MPSLPIATNSVDAPSSRVTSAESIPLLGEANVFEGTATAVHHLLEAKGDLLQPGEEALIFLPGQGGEQPVLSRYRRGSVFRQRRLRGCGRGPKGRRSNSNLPAHHQHGSSLLGPCLYPSSGVMAADQVILQPQ